MKITVIILAIACFGCSTRINEEAQKDSIKKLLEDETRYAAKVDIANLTECWVNSEEAAFMITDNQGTQSYTGFNSLSEAFSQAEPFELDFSRTDFHFIIGKEIAYVSFEQKDNWGGEGERITKETRTLKKYNGQWKIVSANVVDVSSFEETQHSDESFHMTAKEIQPNPNTGLTNLSGIGGMTIGYIEVNEPMDFSPLFEGLPQDMCPSPHWGYVLEGDLRIIYADGKEEKVKAGEVFYWPAPHTGIIDNSVKFIDFSPDEEFKILVDHLTKQ